MTDFPLPDPQDTIEICDAADEADRFVCEVCGEPEPCACCRSSESHMRNHHPDWQQKRPYQEDGHLAVGVPLVRIQFDMCPAQWCEGRGLETRSQQNGHWFPASAHVVDVDAWLRDPRVIATIRMVPVKVTEGIAFSTDADAVLAALRGIGGANV